LDLVIKASRRRGFFLLSTHILAGVLPKGTHYSAYVLAGESFSKRTSLINMSFSKDAAFYPKRQSKARCSKTFLKAVTSIFKVIEIARMSLPLLASFNTHLSGCFTKNELPPELCLRW